MEATERLREALRARACPPQVAPPDVMAVSRAVLEQGGDAVLGIVFFGSRKTRAAPDAWSGYDFFVLTGDYRPFYNSLRTKGCLTRSPRLAAALNAVLPPNQVRIPAETPAGPAVAKCAVISLAAFERDTSSRRRDHFCAGRLFQPAEVLYARDEAIAARILGGLLSAHTLTLSWVRPWLPERFDVEAYGRALLRVSLSYEIRPEPADRMEALWQAQKEYHAAIYGTLLRDLADAGDLSTQEAGVYKLPGRVSLAERLRLGAYFRWSLVRATLRWFKYVVTFEGWLDYILRKVQRHSGQAIALTDRERRLPLIFLWPRVIRYLRRRDR